MISFIVIGRNEGWKLDKCIKSINELISFNMLKDKEIIYIDSDSDDDSIDTAFKNSVDKVYVVTGNYNSAIARNEGAKSATGDLLFFIDGDIEIRPFEIKVILDPGNRLAFNFIVGFLDDVNYSSTWKLVSQTSRTHNKVIEDQRVTTAGGGIFIIEKDTWIRFGGMDERLRRTQDRDLSLRMSQKGLPGIRKKEIFGLHHTIPYKNSSRMKSMLLDGSIGYKGVFIRKHLLNTSYYPILIHEEWTLIILLISLIATIIFPFAGLLYLAAVLVKTLRKSQSGNFRSVIQRILQDFVVFLSVIFFYPKKKKYKISQVKQE